MTGLPLGPVERRVSRILLFFEDIVKVPLFGCRHCGECLLSSTGFVCSQNCPKRLRNGPCGGTRDDGSCEVYPDRKCVWVKIHRRAALLHRLSLLYGINGIHDWALEGTSAWLNVFRKRAKAPALFVRNDARRIQEILTHGISGKDAQSGKEIVTQGVPANDVERANEIVTNGLSGKD